MKGSEKARLILANRGYFNTFQPTQQFVHLSAPNDLCSSSVGSPSTVTFPQAPVAPLHLPISSSAVPLFPSPELYSSFCTHPFGLCPTGTKITAETQRLMCGSMFPPSSTLPTQMVRVWSRVCSYWYCLCCNLAPWHSRFS